MSAVRIAGGAFLVLLLLVLGALAWSNRGLRDAPPTGDVFPEIEQARLAEALHLKGALGDSVWPGWGEFQIPTMLWNEENAFLVGHDAPGGSWTPVHGDSFLDARYHMRPVEALEQELSDGELSAFTERISGRWVTSFGTLEWTRIALVDQIRSELPALLRPFFPYRVLLSAFGTEWYVAGLLHESFHAYQAETMPERFADAEAAYGTSDRYWSRAGATGEAWEAEIEALQRAVQQALRADDVRASASAREFLRLRDRRRAAHRLDRALVLHEQRYEWLEGMAKYVEMEIWRHARTTASYQPLPGMSRDPRFTGYEQTFEQRWPQELAQLARQGGRKGNGRFYYTGMAQAVLLDRLKPGWTTCLGEPGVWVEGLLREAVSPGPSGDCSRSLTPLRHAVAAGRPKTTAARASFCGTAASRTPCQGKGTPARWGVFRAPGTQVWRTAAWAG